MGKETLPDIIIERAVEIWCRSLYSPKHDNGDTSFTGAVGMGLAHQLTEMDRSKVDDFDAAVDRFRAILTERLKYNRDHNGEEIADGKRVFLRRSLGTDYGPDDVLGGAAREAGVPASSFSIKSMVTFYGDESVGESFGYGAPTTYHYPLKDGGWLQTKLYGEDMPLIIEAVEDGRLPALKVGK